MSYLTSHGRPYSNRVLGAYWSGANILNLQPFEVEIETLEEQEKENSSSEILHLLQSNRKNVTVVNIFVSCPLVLLIKAD